MFGNFFFKDTNKYQSTPERVLDAFDIHLQIGFKIESSYKKRTADPKALQQTIDYCLQQINIAEEAKDVWIKEQKLLGLDPHLLPFHKGYTQLCTILEKQKRFDELIKLATQAREQGWRGDWDKRIQRAEIKVNKIKQ